MEASKKAEFVRKFGKKKKLSYFDTGGIALNSTAPGIGGGNLTNTNTQGIGGISSALGLNAASANIQPGTNAAQLSNAYTGAQNAINAQVGLANTLTPQAAAAAANQNAIAQQELAMSQGLGPNPAANQLAQATGQNVANQAALMAGQRGGTANAGLLARQAAQQGATTQQNAAGQAATMQAQQQVAAQQNLANLSGNQVSQAGQAVSNLNQAQQNEQNILQGANTAANQAAVGMQSNINNVNAQANQGILGGITSGLSSVTGGLLAKGGEVHPVHGKNKLDFVHKMAKLGLHHYDGGAAPVTADDSSDSSNLPPEQGQAIQDIARKAFNYADGGQIQSNPLIGAIQNSMSNLGTANYMPQGSSGGLNIPGSNPVSSGPTLAQQAQSGFKSGQAWKAKGNQPNNSTDTLSTANQIGLENQLPSMDTGSQSNVMAQPAIANPVPGMPASNDPNQNMAVQGSINPDETDQTISQGDNSYQNEAKGGSIWDMHPSKHAEYATNHFVNYFKGGEGKKVPSMVSPGERYLSPQEVKKVIHEGANPMKLGMQIPGKAKVKDDSLKNDTVPMTLEEGGVVIPRHITEHKMAPEKAELFVHRAMARKKAGKR